jgi:hypothetical protein
MVKIIRLKRVVLERKLIFLLSSRASDTVHGFWFFSSGRGKSAVAVVRVSGKAARTTLERMTPGRPLPRPRVAALRKLVDPRDGSFLDQSVVLFFQGEFFIHTVSQAYFSLYETLHKVQNF